MRPVMLTQAEPRIPRRLKTVAIPVAAVAGVAILCGVYPTGQARLVPFAWRQDGSRERLGRSSVQERSIWLGGQRLSYPMTRKDPETSLADSAAAAGSSQAGRMTRRVYVRVLAIQVQGAAWRRGSRRSA